MTPFFTFLILLFSRRIFMHIETPDTSLIVIAITLIGLFVSDFINSIFIAVKFFANELMDMKFIEILQSQFYKKLSETKLHNLEDPNYYDDVIDSSRKGMACVVECINFPMNIARNLASFSIAIYVAISYQFYWVFAYIFVFPLVHIMENRMMQLPIIFFKSINQLQRASDLIEGFFHNRVFLHDLKALQHYKKIKSLRDEKINNRQVLAIQEESLFTLYISLRDSIKLAFRYTLCIVLVLRILNGAIHIGDFILIIGILDTFSGSLTMFWNSFAFSKERFFFLERYYKFLDIKNESTEIAKNIDTGHIEVRNVSFKYPGGNSNKSFLALNKVTLSISKGEKIAIVGYNGAGKSTLIKLLLGLYTPNEGEIYLNGIHYSNITNVGNAFSMALQETQKYPLSLKENITISDFELEDVEHYKSVLNECGLSSIVARLPAGDRTPMNKELFEYGTDLSGGEWQRIALCRAMYRNRDILIFDEPLASVDIDTEAWFIDTLLNKFYDNTVIIVTHTLSCIKHVDRIVVMDSGQISECGSHKQLIANEGLYHKLYNAQAKSYEV